MATTTTVIKITTTLYIDPEHSNFCVPNYVFSAIESYNILGENLECVSRTHATVARKRVASSHKSEVSDITFPWVAAPTHENK